MCIDQTALGLIKLPHGVSTTMGGFENMTFHSESDNTNRCAIEAAHNLFDIVTAIAFCEHKKASSSSNLFSLPLSPFFLLQDKMVSIFDKVKLAYR